MIPITSNQPTKDQIRALAKAPGLDPYSRPQETSVGQPLLQPHEFDLNAQRSVRPVSARPIPKAILVGTVLSPIFLVSFLFTQGSTQSKSKLKAAPISPQMQLKTSNITPEDDLRQQLADANAKVAVLGQKPPKSTPLPEKKTSPKPKNSPAVASASTNYVVHRVPQPVRQESLRGPQFAHRYSSIRTAVSSRPASQQVRFPRTVAAQPVLLRSMVPAKTEVAKVVSTADLVSSASTSAWGRWQQLALIGNYGGIPDAQDIDASEEIALNTDTQQSEQTSSIEKPLAQASVPPSINPELEAPVLQRQRTQLRHSILVGTQAQAVLDTPVYWDGKQKNDDQFAVILAKPLLSADGTVILPPETKLIVKLHSLSETGVVHLVAVAALVQQGESVNELMLPKGAIQVRGAEGKPLIAEQPRSRQRNRGVDVGRVALGMLHEAAGELDDSIKNVVEEGTQSLTNNIDQRNTQTLRESTNLRVLASGTKVEVFVNRSFSMPVQSLEKFDSELEKFKSEKSGKPITIISHLNTFALPPLVMQTSKYSWMPALNLLKTGSFFG